MTSIRIAAGRMLLATALAWASLAAAAGTPDFTGTWQINPARGQNLGMMVAVKQTVTMDIDLVMTFRSKMQLSLTSN